MQLPLFSYFFFCQSCTAVCFCPCFHIFIVFSPVLLYTFTSVFISLLFKVLYCGMVLPLFSYLNCFQSCTAVCFCPGFHIFAPVFISLLLSVLYCCMLLPLFLAVVQGAENLAGWKLNFSAPRYVSNS